LRKKGQQILLFNYLLAQCLYFVNRQNGGRKTFTHHIGSDELDQKSSKVAARSSPSGSIFETYTSHRETQFANLINVA
jgi:hypothetical protein